MSRLTITLPDERHAALKAAAAARNTTIGAIIDESLALAGIKTRADALAILRQAGGNSGLDDDEAMSVALQEVADHRAGR